MTQPSTPEGLEADIKKWVREAVRAEVKEEVRKSIQEAFQTGGPVDSSWGHKAREWIDEALSSLGVLSDLRSIYSTVTTGLSSVPNYGLLNGYLSQAPSTALNNSMAFCTKFYGTAHPNGNGRANASAGAVSPAESVITTLIHDDFGWLLNFDKLRALASRLEKLPHELAADMAHNSLTSSVKGAVSWFTDAASNFKGDGAQFRTDILGLLSDIQTAAQNLADAGGMHIRIGNAHHSKLVEMGLAVFPDEVLGMFAALVPTQDLTDLKNHLDKATAQISAVPEVGGEILLNSLIVVQLAAQMIMEGLMWVASVFELEFGAELGVGAAGGGEVDVGGSLVAMASAGLSALFQTNVLVTLPKAKVGTAILGGIIVVLAWVAALVNAMITAETSGSTLRARRKKLAPATA